MCRRRRCTHHCRTVHLLMELGVCCPTRLLALAGTAGSWCGGRRWAEDSCVQAAVWPKSCQLNSRVGGEGPPRLGYHASVVGDGFRAGDRRCRCRPVMDEARPLLALAWLRGRAWRVLPHRPRDSPAHGGDYARADRRRGCRCFISRRIPNYEARPFPIIVVVVVVASAVVGIVLVVIFVVFLCLCVCVSVSPRVSRVRAAIHMPIFTAQALASSHTRAP